jgi:hypothetical protein
MHSAVVGRNISRRNVCCGVHDVVILVLSQIVEIKGIFIDGCLDAQGKFVLRRDLNL